MQKQQFRNVQQKNSFPRCRTANGKCAGRHACVFRSKEEAHRARIIYSAREVRRESWNLILALSLSLSLTVYLSLARSVSVNYRNKF